MGAIETREKAGIVLNAGFGKCVVVYLTFAPFRNHLRRAEKTECWSWWFFPALHNAHRIPVDPHTSLISRAVSLSLGYSLSFRGLSICKSTITWEGSLKKLFRIEWGCLYFRKYRRFSWTHSPPKGSSIPCAFFSNRGSSLYSIFKSYDLDKPTALLLCSLAFYVRRKETLLSSQEAYHLALFCCTKWVHFKPSPIVCLRTQIMIP